MVNTQPKKEIKCRPKTVQTPPEAAKLMDRKSNFSTAAGGGKSTNRPMRVQLPPNYNTAKLLYKASKSRAAARDGKGADGEQIASISLKPSNRDDAATPSMSELISMPPPTVESGLQALRLLRPIDNKTYEFGLANGIQLHLIESVKLCGLKKAREKSITDMIATLCNHLTSREDEISRWIEFADRVALKAGKNRCVNAGVPDRL